MNRIPSFPPPDPIRMGNYVNQYPRTCGDLKTLMTSRHQRSSRFAGMRIACFKEFLQVHLESLRDLFPDELPFQPRGWCLPEEGADFAKVLKRAAQESTAKGSDGAQTFIVKPSEASQGTGIFLVQRPEDMPPNYEQMKGAFVAQEYVDPPMLLDGFKFDLRCAMGCASLLFAGTARRQPPHGCAPASEGFTSSYSLWIPCETTSAGKAWHGCARSLTNVSDGRLN